MRGAKCLKSAAKACLSDSTATARARLFNSSLVGMALRGGCVVTIDSHGDRCTTGEGDVEGCGASVIWSLYGPRSVSDHSEFCNRMNPIPGRVRTSGNDSSP